MPSGITAHPRAGKLLEAGLALASELSLPTVLQRIVDLAAEVTGARYGALGVIGPDGWLIEFATALRSTPGEGTTVRLTAPVAGAEGDTR